MYDLQDNSKHSKFLCTLLHEIFVTLKFHELSYFEKITKLKCHEKRCHENLLPRKLIEVYIVLKIK